MSLATVETGDRWEIRRKYVSIEHARRVTRSALWLADQKGVLGIDQRHPWSILDRTRGLTERGVNMTVLRNQDSPLLRHPDAGPVLDMVTLLNQESGDTTGGFLVSTQLPAGRIGWHRDNDGRSHADDSLSLNLQGRCRVGVKDGEGTEYYYDLEVGDAFYLDNSGADHQRPFHTVWNKGLTRRTALID